MTIERLQHARGPNILALNNQK